MKKIITILFALIVCIGMAFAAPTGYTEFISQEAITNGSSEFNHNVTWNSDHSSAVFSGNNCYLTIANPLTNAGIGTGFSIRFEVWISSENNSDGKYLRANGKDKVGKNGYQRLFDLSDGTSANMFFINAGSSAHLRTIVHYLQDVEANHRLFTAVSKTYYDAWHVVELVVAPGGYGTLYVDDTPVSWYTPSSSNDNVVKIIEKLNTFNTCYIGTSIYEVQDYEANHDGFFIGEMKSIGTASKAMRPLYNGTNYFYTIGFESNGGTAVDGISALDSTIPASLPEPTKDGYSFDGWYVDSALKTKVASGTTMTANITLYAKWKSLHQHNWTYTSSMNDIFAYCTEESYSSQCSYQGLGHAVSLKLVSNKADLNAKILPAEMSDTPVTWTSSDTSVATVDENGFVKTLKKGSITITAKANDGSGKSDTATVKVLGSCKVTFNANGGSGGGVYYVPEGSKLGNNVKTFPTATRSDYAFAGWSTDGGTTYAGSSDVITSDVTYKAVWHAEQELLLAFARDPYNTYETCGFVMVRDNNTDPYSQEIHKGAVVTLVWKDSKLMLEINDHGTINYANIYYMTAEGFPGIKVSYYGKPTSNGNVDVYAPITTLSTVGDSYTIPDKGSYYGTILWLYEGYPSQDLFYPWSDKNV